MGTLPLDDFPDGLTESVRKRWPVVTIEEHYGACGLGEALSYQLLTRAVFPQSFTSLHAAGYPTGRYGSQHWHQEESGLAGQGLRSHLRKIIHGRA